MPRSRSRSVLSIARSATRSLARKMPLWCSRASTSVVLPWSTWAMMATLRRSALATMVEVFRSRASRQYTKRGRSAESVQIQVRAPGPRSSPQLPVASCNFQMPCT